MQGFILIVCTAGCVSKSLTEEPPRPFEKDTCLESPLVGVWESERPSGDRLTFQQDCTGVSARCQSRFFFPPNAAKAGLFNLKVIESDGPDECLSRGTYRCSLSLMTNSATLLCEGKSFQLKRQ
jgi:hypothetical protein